MKPPISWPGGKRLLADRITAKFTDHTHYVEVFGGGLAVFLSKEPSRYEVVNDLNSDLVGFYRCTRFHKDELIRELEYILNSREEFDDFVDQVGLTDIQRAARWFVRNKISFGAKGKHFGTSKKGGGAAFGSRRNRLAAIDALNDRLDRVCVEHLDWSDLLDRYDAPTTLFYFDPPYTEGYQYENLAWSRIDHVNLRDRILGLQGRWVLSYDDSPFVRMLYEGMEMEEVVRARGIGNNHATIRRDYHELIISPPAT